jgi:ATP/maltotriose-dependent transcriptional regulator MalT/DNA-binding winged helix-turn-helix (wHTH) protein
MREGTRSGAMIPARKRLLARFEAIEPRLIRLCAPPGYGKAELAAVWARRFDRRAVCDCSDVEGIADFVGRVMSALARESATGAETLAQRRLFLHATEADVSAWRRALLECWKARQERALLILENADALAARPDVLELAGDMLAARPPDRVVLVSSRNPLPLDVARYVAPHQILTLSSCELQLGESEAAAVFDGVDLSASTVDRILQVAEGWPMILLLLARIAHYESKLDALLDRLATIETGLHECLVADVLSALTPEMMSAMLAVAAIPCATIEDISVATGIAHVAPIVEGLLRLPGFVSYESGTYHVHPLLGSELRVGREEEFAKCILRAARGNETLGDFLRAAELYGAAGDRASAAAALDRLPAAALRQPSLRAVDALTQIPVGGIAERPNLWIATLPYRVPAVDAERLHRESVALHETALCDKAPARRRLGSRRAALAAALNRLTEAGAVLDGLRFAGADDLPEERSFVAMTAAMVAAKQGRFFDADDLVVESDSVRGERHMRFEEERAQIAMCRTLMHGDWDELLKFCEERLAAALRTGPTERIVRNARAVAQAAWYANDDDRVAAARQILENSGLTLPESIEAEAIADLQIALTTGDVERAAALLDRAIDRTDAGENDFLRIFVRVCAALLAPAQRRRLLEARSIAQRIESPPLQTSIELLIDSPEPSDYGIFKRLAERAARSPLRVRRDRLYVDIMHGEVRRGSEELHVSNRGLELLAALALFESGSTNEELAAALWPRLDRKDGVNALKMCVSRTRAQIGDRESIQNARNGYVLGEQVGSDVRESERLLHSVRAAGTLGESLRRQVSQMLDTWTDRPPSHALDWRWFEPFAASLLQRRRELAHALERDVVRR